MVGDPLRLNLPTGPLDLAEILPTLISPNNFPTVSGGPG